MCRSEMEELCSDFFENVEKTLKECLEKSKLALTDIHSVEIVGGSTRIPAVKSLIEKTFQKPASTTLNQDEAVARGCALQCAMLSPAVRVRDFSVTDLQVYPVVMEWDPSPNEPKDSKNFITVFPELHAAPFSKKMTLYQNKPFAIQLYYEGNIPYPSKFIGKCHLYFFFFFSWPTFWLLFLQLHSLIVWSYWFFGFGEKKFFLLSLYVLKKGLITD